MNRVQQYLCSIAWRILWRWWPDRVYFAVVDDLSTKWVNLQWGVVEAGVPTHPNKPLLEGSYLAFEKLDHPGKMVKCRD